MDDSTLFLYIMGGLGLYVGVVIAELAWRLFSWWRR